MTDVHLNAADAAELAETLLFVRDWITRDNPALAPSLAEFVGADGYGLPDLREDLTRFAFLLGGDHQESFLNSDGP